MVLVVLAAMLPTEDPCLAFLQPALKRFGTLERG